MGEKQVGGVQEMGRNGSQQGTRLGHWQAEGWVAVAEMVVRGRCGAKVGWGKVGS